MPETKDQNIYRTAKYVNDLKKQVMIDTTEEFKPYPKNEEYLVSNRGRVYSCKRDAIMNEFASKDGYPKVNIDRNPTKIHNLVAETFLKKPEDPKCKYVNHKDGVKYHNEVENLEYCTKSHNIKQAYDYGLEKGKRGESNGRATMTEIEAESVCKKLEEGKSYRQISDEMGWKYDDKIKFRLNKIKSREAWTYISNKYNF